MSIVEGKVESKSKKGTGVKVGGVWYNGSAATLMPAVWKNDVKMEVDDERNVISCEAAGGGGGAAPAARGGGGSNNVQAAIMFQSSRKDAIQVACTLLSEGVLPIPAGKDKKYDAFMAFTDQLTDTYFEQASLVQETGDLPDREEG
jgi:hypothetical protein